MLGLHLKLQYMNNTPQNVENGNIHLEHAWKQSTKLGLVKDTFQLHYSPTSKPSSETKGVAKPRSF